MRYLNGRPPAYVVSIVRKANAARLDRKVRDHKRWLGEVTWTGIEGDLKGLPLEGKNRQHWLDFLAVLETDGDFDQVRPKRSSERDRVMAEAVAERTLRT